MISILVFMVALLIDVICLQLWTTTTTTAAETQTPTSHSVWFGQRGKSLFEIKNHCIVWNLWNCFWFCSRNSHIYLHPYLLYLYTFWEIILTCNLHCLKLFSMSFIFNVPLKYTLIYFLSVSFKVGQLNEQKQ